jgi:hypothetical protein
VRAIRRALPLVVAGLTALLPLAHVRAAAPAMVVAPARDVAGPLTPGMRIGVTIRALPPTRRAYCLGLASAIDRYGLPVSLGRVTRDSAGVGRVVATIPPRLFPAEPSGPFLLFVGTCTPVAPDRPFLAQTVVKIVPSHTAPARPSV